jgi:membrane-associated phospholipid phosphatase
MKKRLDFFLRENHVLNTRVINNFNNLKLSALVFPFLLLLLIVVYFYINNAFTIKAYVQTQKEFFLYLNSQLAQFPSLQFNLTQLGDVLIFLPFLTIFMVYAPKFWEALITSLIASAIFTNLLKKLFAVPRPAAMFDHDSFVIIGKALKGHNSLPSGHSIATFTVLSSVLFAFMPIKLKYKVVWFIFILTLGLIIAFTRVGVGAHYPIDVIVGSIIGYISALTGVFINEKINLWTWLTNKKYYFISIILFAIGAVAIFLKIINTNLMIFYFSLISLLATQFIITYIYVKK